MRRFERGSLKIIANKTLQPGNHVVLNTTINGFSSPLILNLLKTKVTLTISTRMKNESARWCAERDVSMSLLVQELLRNHLHPKEIVLLPEIDTANVHAAPPSVPVPHRRAA